MTHRRNPRFLKYAMGFKAMYQWAIGQGKVCIHGLVPCPNLHGNSYHLTTPYFIRLVKAVFHVFVTFCRNQLAFDMFAVIRSNTRCFPTIILGAFKRDMYVDRSLVCCLIFMNTKFCQPVPSRYYQCFINGKACMFSRSLTVLLLQCLEVYTSQNSPRGHGN